MEKAILDAVGGFLTKVLTAAEKASGKKMGPPRPMKFPYTFTAKLMQFPYRFYVEKCWVFKYWCISVVLCLPLFYKLERLCEFLAGLDGEIYIFGFVAKSPGNVAQWKALQEKEKHHDEDHEVHIEEPIPKADDSE